MIHKLRAKLIVASMLSLTLVLLVILGGVHLTSYRRLVSDADTILAVLAENGGRFPQRTQPSGEGFPAGGDFPPAGDAFPAGDTDRELKRRGFSPETPFESRFFTVLLDEAGQPLSADTGMVAAVDGDTALAYARKVWATGRAAGFYGDYRFLSSPREDGTQLIFLDCGRSLTAFRATLLASAAASLAGLAAVLALLMLCSKRIIKPIIESYEKQKRFITDAGHELKTPLTIIGADADLLELDCGGSEWLADIRRQANRLTGLTNDLIYLSRMDEAQPQLRLLEFSLSDMVEELSQSFQGLALARGKRLQAAITPLVSVTGDEQALRQLTSILLDNAVKYTPEGGEIAVGLAREGRAVKLTVTNPTAQPLDREALDRLFDRFYRTDQSRSAETGGYGLGLAIARSIVQAHRGRIRAESGGPQLLTIMVTLPG